ncbi:MAG: S-methyl-5-thioribose-1-phosphate isomerase [Deferribacterales bacterium]
MSFESLPYTLRWQEDILYVIDQTLLPEIFIEVPLRNIDEVYVAIKTLQVRGAPAIGVAGAYGLCICAQKHLDEEPNLFMENLGKDAKYLNSSRPTAVNLSWAIKRIMKRLYACVQKSTADMYAEILDEATRIHKEDLRTCRMIGEHGRELIQDGFGILTHCNAGSLATSRLGTATAPMYLAQEQKKRFKVYADETRPLCQGSRLTAWELQRAGLDVTLICDDMAASVMASGRIQLVIVGADRVAANGDTANKIGTLGVAIMAKHFGIPFYVACPTSTLDMKTSCGYDIEIEQRGNDEVCFFGEKRTAPVDINVLNPAFDVTPAYLISGFITEKGIVKRPYENNLKAIF